MPVPRSSRPGSARPLPQRIEAYVFAYNPASVWVVEKAGFEREGYLRKLHKKRGVCGRDCVGAGEGVARLDVGSWKVGSWKVGSWTEVFMLNFCPYSCQFKGPFYICPSLFNDHPPYSNL